ncbi:hypothetical protein MMC15_000883, partial [Xylographa vitiligo]|nr:hypothetical protein [Xylographa vitiligo]
MRKRRTGLRHPASKVEKLEEKLDGLVTLLRSSNPGTPGVFNVVTGNSVVEEVVSPNLGKSSGLTVGSYAYDRPQHIATVLPDSAFIPLACSSSSGSASTNLPPLLHPDLEPSLEDAESYLIRFRTDFVKRLPFIIIPPSTTAHQLRQERPFLWLSVMAVASTQSTQQIALSKKVREIFGREAYLEGTRNMDLLLAVLTYAT